MSKPKILVQLDSDPHASVFDAVVAIDAGVDQLLPRAGISKEQVQDLVHGTMFTRGPQDLHQTAIFIGGSSVALGESILEKATSCFFGPLRVSVMLDANGANTTAAAAVLAAGKHVNLNGATTLVLGATGPVGERVVRLLARQGAHVRVGSRSADRAEQTCQRVKAKVEDASLLVQTTGGNGDLHSAMDDCQAVIAAGALGVQLLPNSSWSSNKQLQVAVDLNAVPPTGIEGIEVTDKAVAHENVTCYGAIGVGALKMKIHKEAIRRLFQSNDQVLDAEEIYTIGSEIL